MSPLHLAKLVDTSSLHVAREPVKIEEQLGRLGDLVLPRPQLVNVPCGEDELALGEVGLLARSSDQEVGG